MNIELIKAFTSNPEQGNPAGVIFDADNLLPEEMIRIAARLGYSESVFLMRSNSTEADYRFRFMTPITEVDACGHATLAGAKAVYDREPFEVLSIETAAGIVKVERNKDGSLMMKMAMAELGSQIYKGDEISKLLNISSIDLMDLPIRTASVGSHKLIVPIKNLKTVESIMPDFEAMIEFCKNNPVKGFYVFTQEVINPKSNFHTRQFNPAAGIFEDPITGIAGGALALYAKEYNLVDSNQIIIEQGFEIGKPGQIIVQIKDDNVYVGGNAIKFGSRDL